MTLEINLRKAFLRENDREFKLALPDLLPLQSIGLTTKFFVWLIYHNQIVICNSALPVLLPIADARVAHVNELVIGVHGHVGMTEESHSSFHRFLRSTEYAIDI
jgi:hypothetical protein